MMWQQLGTLTMAGTVRRLSVTPTSLGIAVHSTMDAGATAQAKKRNKMMEGLIRATQAQNRTELAS